MVFLSTGLREPSIPVGALTTASIVLLIGLFVPKTRCVCMWKCRLIVRATMFSKSGNQNISFLSDVLIVLITIFYNFFSKSSTFIVIFKIILP